jgi:hypothetical protein
VSTFDLHSAVLADDRDFVRWFFAAVDDRARELRLLAGQGFLVRFS